MLSSSAGREKVSGLFDVTASLVDNPLAVNTMLYSWPIDLGGFMQYFQGFQHETNSLDEFCSSWTKTVQQHSTRHLEF